MLYKLLLSGFLLFPSFFGTGFQERPLKFDNNMITVRKIGFPCKKPPVALVEKMLDSCKVQFNQIDIVNWKSFPYKPDVKFRIAYSKEEIYLQYIVKEKYIRAFYTKDEGSKPYQDSCVEFFIIPGLDSIYYNLELNCIGTGTFAGGANRKDRTRFNSDVTSLIRRSSSLGKEGFDTKEGNYEWTITIVLPISLFSLSEFPALEGRVVKANFYKCGDELPERHYLSWNPILLDSPNFHSPEYFGELYFEN